MFTTALGVMGAEKIASVEQDIAARPAQITTCAVLAYQIVPLFINQITFS
jgi:hypothetical protein